MKINKQYNISANRQAVFDAWISSDMLVSPVFKIEVEPKTGGRYIIHARMGDQVSLMEGQFLEFIPNQCLKYSWCWQGSDENTVVTVNFMATSAGTEIRLLHEGFESEESKAVHDSGWDAYIQGLSNQIANK